MPHPCQLHICTHTYTNGHEIQIAVVILKHPFCGTFLGGVGILKSINKHIYVRLTWNRDKNHNINANEILTMREKVV